MEQSQKDIKEDKIPKSIMNSTWILVLGAIMPMLDSTMVNVAINHLIIDFSADLNSIQWVITVYILALAVSVPLAGWAVQRFNGKWLMIGANILFLVGSIACGFSWESATMIIFRIIQGLSAGFIMTLIMTLIVEIAGINRLGRIMSIVGIPTVLGPIMGPVIGAVILQYLSWRFIFFVNIPIGILAIILMTLKLPNFTPSNIKAKFDFIGIFLLGISSAAIIYGITESVKNSTFNNSTTITFIIIGIIALIAYILYAAKKKNDAILPLKLFRLKNFNAVMINLFLLGIALNGPMLLLPLFFQNITGFSVLYAGLILIPQGIGMLVIRPLTGKMTDKIGARNVVLVNLTFTIIGTLPFAFFDQSSSLTIMSIVLFIRGMGIGGVFVPLMSDAYVNMVKQEIAQASVGTRIIQNVGGAFGSAVLATVINLSIQGEIPDITNMTIAYHDGFTLTLILCLIMIIPSLFLTNKKNIK